MGREPLSRLRRKHKLISIYFTLVGWANSHETTILWEGKSRIIPRGSLVLGLNELSEFLGMPKTTVYRGMQTVTRMELIRNESGTLGSIITICNYEQIPNTPEKVEQEWNESGMKVEQEWTLIKNKKKELEKEKKSYVGIRMDYPQAFQDFWIQYGRRGDKKDAYSVFQKLKLTEIEATDLGAAIKNYCKEVTEIRYRKHFCRFLNSDWRELVIPRIGGTNWDQYWGSA